MKPTNHIEEYFLDKPENSQERTSKELFTADSENVDVKTDIDNYEISLINTMKLNDEILKTNGLKSVFELYFNNLLRLKISKDRKSRSEFVQLNKQDNSDSLIDGMKTAGTMFGGGK